MSGSPPSAELSNPSPFIGPLFSDPVWPYTLSDSFSTLEKLDMVSTFIGSLFNDPAWPDIPSDSFSTLDELDTSFTFIESLFNDLISLNFYTSVDNSSPLSEPFTPAPSEFPDPLSQLPLSPLYSTTYSLPSTQDFKKETSPPDPVSLFFANEEASSPAVITPGKRQREEKEEKASLDEHLYKARKIDLPRIKISEDDKNEILNCLEKALGRAQGREAVRKKLRSLQDYLYSTAGTEDMKTIYHYYALAKTWGLSNDFFYFIVDNSVNNEEDLEEAEPAQLSDNFIQYLQLRQQREKLLKKQDKQAKYFASFEKLIGQTEQSEFNSQPLVQILESYRKEASDQLKKINRKLAKLSRKNGYPFPF